MSEIATVLMKPGSGMTLAAAALASGLIAQGLSICVIVPTIADAEKFPEIIPRDRVRPAEKVTSMIRVLPQAYIFDDALRCSAVFSRHGEGDLVTIALDRFSLFQDRLTRLYLFQYTA
ncbi:TPA: hypothetical protein ACQVH3_004678 [Serratia marcescens]